MSAPATNRGLLTALLDRFVGKQAGLPPEKCHYVTSEVRIPVTNKDERFELMGNLYRPILTDPSSKSCGTVLVYGPYGRGIELTVRYAHLYAARGYHVLFISSRGTYGSQGTWQPFRTEAFDGQVIVRWMREQPWYTGSFATIGMSFLGYTQLALLSEPPKDMVAAVMEVPPHDVGEFCWGAGAMNMDLVVWSEGVKNQGEPSIFDFLGPFYRAWSLLGAARRLQPVFDGVPLLDAARKHFGSRSPWVHEWIARSNPSDPYYEPMRQSRALDVAKIPILLIAGWHDVLLTQNLEQHRRLTAHNHKIGLIIGPWAHTQLEGTITETFSWLETHLAQQPNTNPQQKQWDEASARIFITGINEWRMLPQWPPAGTTPLTFFLHPDRLLSHILPADSPESKPSFTFDPRSPTPTIGGPFIGIQAGIRDDTALSARPDVLTFTTAPLDSALPIFGAPSIAFAHESDTPHVDLLVRISEVGLDGRSRNVTEGYQRLDPKREKGEEVRFGLRECAHVFAKGTRVRVYVAGGSSRIWHRNPGTGEDAVRAGEVRAATHWIGCGTGTGTVSRVVVPVLEG